MFFVRLRTMVKNRIRGLLDRYPELAKSQPCKDMFCREGLVWLRGVSLKREDQQILNEELELYDALERHIRRSDGLVGKLGEGDERVKLLETIPGIGKFFGVLIAHEVDDVTRFSSEKKFFGYIGIVPSTHSSGGRTYHGRLTKQGNKYLRWAFVEAIWPAVRGDPSLAAYYARIKARSGPNPAKIATARRLATIVYRVLSQRRPYYRSQVAGPRLSSENLGGLE